MLLGAAPIPPVDGRALEAEAEDIPRPAVRGDLLPGRVLHEPGHRPRASGLEHGEVLVAHGVDCDIRLVDDDVARVLVEPAVLPGRRVCSFRPGLQPVEAIALAAVFQA